TVICSTAFVSNYLSLTLVSRFFFLYSYRHHRDLHSFPTRRSSDLLREQGMIVDDWKQDMRRQLSIQKLLNREVLAKITITDQKVADYYSANKAQFNFAEPTYHLAQIVVTPRKDQQIRNRKNDDASNESEALRKTKMLMDRLNSG